MKGWLTHFPRSESLAVYERTPSASPHRKPVSPFFSVPVFGATPRMFLAGLSFYICWPSSVMSAFAPGFRFVLRLPSGCVSRLSEHTFLVSQTYIAVSTWASPIEWKGMSSLAPCLFYPFQFHIDHSIVGFSKMGENNLFGSGCNL